MKNLGKCIIKFLNKIFEHKAKVTTVPEKELRIKYFFFYTIDLLDTCTKGLLN